MTQVTVGIRDLKAQLSKYIQQVKSGETVIITERGKPIGRIVPTEPTTEARLKELEQAGMLAWSGRKLQPALPMSQTRGDKTVAEMLLEDRE